MYNIFQMRMATIIAVCFFCMPLLYAQTAEEEVARLKQKTGQTLVEDPEPGTENAEKGDTENKIPGSINVSLGTSYSYMKGYGSGMAFYVAPAYTLPLNNRWALHAGVIATQYQSFAPVAPQESYFPSSFSSFSVFMAASYQMSDKLVLHGTGVKQLISAPPSPFTPYPMDNLSLGATYKLGDNISIGATIHMNRGYGYYTTPMNGYMFPPPFGR